MKISTTWTVREWQEALTKVFKLADDFEEILTFALERDLINTGDIIHAADMYQDPNKLDDLDDDDLKEIIKDRGLSDIMSLIQDVYCLDDIVEELNEDEVLDYYSDETLLEHLQSTYALEEHDSEVRNQYDYDLREQIVDDVYRQNRNDLKHLIDLNADDLHRFICNVIGCGYYDQERLNEGLKKLQDKLNTNNYNIKYE